MAVLKCKMCGGELSIEEGSTVCECEFCGSKQTVSTIDNEKIMKLFERANRLRMANEFDKASGVYESIISEVDDDAEAYWGLVLCKYGIEYVDDPATGNKIPTCHRSSFDSIMEDSDFEMVMENSDTLSRSVYREQAKQIEEIRKGIIEVSSNEEPYDIFICYKETDEDGNRTLDSVLAQDVYDALTDKGYRVFFSRITLEDKLGQEYEPYIFAALNSAKIMLAFGTSYDYYNAVWVKNEWSRYLKLMAKDKTKHLIPCYKDIDAYDMPKEFKHLQAQDLGKVGATQDLLRGIGKILGTNNKAVVNSFNGNFNLEESAMIMRGNLSLEDGDFEQAEGYFERALDINPTNAKAYLGKFLTSYKVPSLACFEEKVCWLNDSKEFKRAEQFADAELLKELKSFREANDLKIERLRVKDVIRKTGMKKLSNESMHLLSQCTKESYKKSLELFEPLKDSAFDIFEEVYHYKFYIDTQYTVLTYLKDVLDVCSYDDIINNTSRRRRYNFVHKAFDQLVECGLVEKDNNGYCWPNAKEEKEKLWRQKVAYVEACAKVKAQIDNEIAIESNRISEKFDCELNAVQREVDEAINRNCRKRQECEQQILDLTKQKSLLGFFKLQEKKMLQAQIEDMQRKIDSIPSKEAVQSSFQSKIDLINKEKNASIEEMIIKVRSKHKMPALKDFVEEYRLTDYIYYKSLII